MIAATVDFACVCVPQASDICNGVQLECAQCLRCVDACAGIIQSLKRSSDLIKHASPSTLGAQKPRVLWPRACSFGQFFERRSRKT